MIKTNTNNELLLREKIIKFALQQYGSLYVHGKHGPDSFDCAGFAWFVYNEMCNIDIYKDGFGLSTTTRIMTSCYGKNNLYDENDLNKNIDIINSGDILFFHRQSIKDNKPRIDNKYPGHCGIYLSDNYFIHCSSKKEKVIIGYFKNNNYWKKVLVGSKNIISDSKVLKK